MLLFAAAPPRPRPNGSSKYLTVAAQAPLPAHASHRLLLACRPPPPLRRLPFRALLAIAESILDLEQRVVWQISDADMQRVLQAYTPLKHAAHHIFHAPRIPLQDLLGHPHVSGGPACNDRTGRLPPEQQAPALHPFPLKPRAADAPRKNT